MFKISGAANLAIHALTYIASNTDSQPVSTARVAKEFGASDNHLSKIFQRLTKQGIVEPIRGPQGGFCMNRDPKDITLLDIFEAFDGDLCEENCLWDKSTCVRKSCVFGDLLTNINAQVSDYFSSTTLADLVEGKGVGCKSK